MNINKFKELILKHKIISTILISIVALLVLVVALASITTGLNTARTNFSKNYYERSISYEYGNEQTDSLSSEQGLGSNFAPSKSSETYQTEEQRKVIQTASLDIFVNNTEESVQQIKNISTKYNGYVESSNIRETKNSIKSGYVTLKVPKNQFGSAIEEIKSIAEKVRGESTNSSDVTDRYVDLSANLTNYRAEENQYLEIMKKAYTVEDILKVQQKLSDVRGRIERTQAQLVQIERQTEMSTITVNITSEPDVEILGVTWKPLNTIRAEFRDFVLDMKSIFESIIAFFFLLPGLIIRIVFFVLILVIIIKIIKLIYRKFIKNDKI